MAFGRGRAGQSNVTETIVVIGALADILAPGS
jgi:hypothetical protein